MSDNHFYTISATERNQIIDQHGFQNEGIACYVFPQQTAKTTPLYRLLNAETNDHFYTTSQSARSEFISKKGYQNQGIACHVLSKKTKGATALYQLFSSKRNNHFYTTSVTERGRVIKNDGYQDEGIACYVFAEPLPGTVPMYRLYQPTSSTIRFGPFPIRIPSIRPVGSTIVGLANSALVMDYVRGIPKLPFQPPTNTDGELVGKASMPAYENNVPGTKNLETYHLAKAVQNLAAFDPNAAVLYPGSIVQGNSVHSGQLAPIPLKRATGTITLTNINFSDPQAKYVAQIPNPTLANVVTAQRQLLAQPTAAQQPARIGESEAFVHSSEEFALRVDASYSWLTGNAKAFFDYASKSDVTCYTKQLTQAYYTVSFVPDAADGFFDPSVTLTQAKQYMGPNNPPLYVSSITYGRCAYFLVLSKNSETDVKAALDAAYNAVATSGKVNINANYRNILNTSDSYLLVIGGGGSTAASLVKMKWDDNDQSVEIWNKFVEEGANFGPSSPAAIISYQLSYLQDQSPAVLSLATNYTRSTFEAATTNSIHIILHTADDDKDKEEAIEIWIMRGGTEVGHNNWYEGIRMPDNRDFPYDINLVRPVAINEFGEMQLRLYKHPYGSRTGCGWNMDLEAWVTTTNLMGTREQHNVLPRTKTRYVGDGHKFDISFQMVNPYDATSRGLFNGLAIEDKGKEDDIIT